MKILLQQNGLLFWFGAFNFCLALIFGLLSQVLTIQVAGANAFFKPIKFALSIAVFSWTMAHYLHYLPDYDGRFYAWTVVVLLGFEIFYIGLQAARGQMSHFNLSSLVYHLLYTLMALAASMVTLYTAWIGLKFWGPEVAPMSPALLWALRLGFILFVVFSFQGFALGSRLSHTVGGPDGGPGIPFLGWSLTAGDLRIAHFLGMHALQVLPLLVYAGIKSEKWIIGMGILYLLLALFTWILALKGISFMGKGKIFVPRPALASEKR